MNRFLVAAVLTLALCGCGKKADSGAKAAGGEVLPGTISDAMIDSSTSQAEAPMMPIRVDKAKAGPAPADSASEGTADAPDAAPPETAATTPGVVASPKPAANNKATPPAKPAPN